MGNTGSHKRNRVFSSGSESSVSPNEDKASGFSIEVGKVELLSPAFEVDDSVPSVFRDKVLNSSSGTNTISIPTGFEWNEGGKHVFVAGTFSDWKPIPMVKSKKDFLLIVNLPEGEHQYRYLVDGKWMHSENQTHVNNDNGTKNNLVTVKKSDHQVFEALAEDLSNSKAASKLYSSSEGFSQEILDKSKYYDEKLLPLVPPLLPPHLRQVILNQEVSYKSESTLPKPHYVLLYHLYALSIKDKVIVVSATLRFREKYVTTVLYKAVPAGKSK